MKLAEPDKFALAIKTVQDLDLKQQQTAYDTEIRELGLMNSSFIVIQSLGLNEYLAKDRLPGNVYHLTLADDRRGRGGIADGDVIVINFVMVGLFSYTDWSGRHRTVRKLRELTLLPPKPKRMTFKELEDQMRRGQQYHWAKRYKASDGKMVTTNFRLIWESRSPHEQAARPSADGRSFDSRLFRMHEHEWANGNAPAKMMPVNKGVGVLSFISGRFLGGGESVWVTTDPDGFWYLKGQSMQRIWVRAMAIEPAGIQPFGASRTVTWKSGEPTVRLVDSRQGFACLSGLAGQFLAGETFVRVRLDPDGWWYLEGNGPKSISGMATVVPWASGIPQREMKTYKWNKGDAPIKMLHRDEGFCFLSGIGGGFNGGGECVSVYVGDDGFWYLHGNTGRTLTRGEAVAVRFPR